MFWSLGRSFPHNAHGITCEKVYSGSIVIIVDHIFNTVEFSASKVLYVLEWHWRAKPMCEDVFQQDSPFTLMLKWRETPRHNSAEYSPQATNTLYLSVVFSLWRTLDLIGESWLLMPSGIPGSQRQTYSAFGSSYHAWAVGSPSQSEKKWGVLFKMCRGNKDKLHFLGQNNQNKWC